MKKIILFLIFIILFIYKAESQISYGGKPYSFLKREALIENIPEKIMPVLNIRQLMYEDSLEAGKLLPWRFGKDIDVNYNLDNSGFWQTLNNGDRLCRLSIKSKNAVSLNFIFNQFKLPEGATFFIYNENRTKVLGAFTEKNNRDDGVFATTIIRGETAILEYYEPVYARGKGIIQLSKVIHGYRDILKNTKSFNSSGTCNININCDEGLPWYNEKRSVAMILQSNNSRICTGAIINNVKQDGVPYFLTANHCTESETLSTWIFMFNYESPDCTNQDGITDQTLQGADLIATNIPSDFSLLELHDIPPLAYNVYYSGWSAVDEPNDSCVTIHHPSGDIKKISFEYDSIISSSWDSGEPGSHWTVPHWDKGTTERGSSGAPLFDKNHKIIGQLHGGNATCSTIADDNFGKFAYSWDKAPASGNQLKVWLDPENTGTKVLNGKDFNHPASNLDAALINLLAPAAGSMCESSVTPSFIMQNFGMSNLTSLDIYYKFDDGNPILYKWTGNLKYMNFTKVNLNPIYLGLGSHKLSIYSENPNNSVDENRNNDSLKVNFNTVSGNQVTISLKTDNFADETSWDLKDSKNNIILSNTPLKANTLYNSKICLDKGCYKFTIYDNYGDGICQGINENDTGYVKITSNNILLGYINGCNFESSAAIDFCLNENFKLYPNLNDGDFYIYNPEENNIKAECIVYSVLGDIVTRFPLESNHNEYINLKWLKSGLYFLSITDSKGRRVKKIIIARDNN